jgi:translation initiation factor 4E
VESRALCFGSNGDGFARIVVDHCNGSPPILHFFIHITEWVLWEHKASESRNPTDWKDNMTEICSFSNVVDFWRYMNHLPKPSEVFFDGEARKLVDGKTVEEYSLFKKGIEPEWGDAANVTGGEFFCRQFFESEVLDLYWQNLVLAVIGEALEKDGSCVVNGCRVLDKSRGYPQFKLELWLQARDPSTKEFIQNRLMETITDGQPTKIKAHPKFEWKDHSP